jgi:hypothetical protein
MKRRYFISLVLAATTTIAIGQLAIAQDHPKIRPFKATTADEKAIIAVFNQRYPTDSAITELVVIDGYGLLNQITGETGGQVLVRKDTKQGWQIVRGTGGVLDVKFMVKQGCPEITAKALQKLIQRQSKEHYETHQNHR